MEQSVRSAVRAAAGCILVSWVAIVLVSVVAILINQDTRMQPEYTYANDIRLSLLSTSVCLAIFSAASFARVQSPLDSVADDSSLICTTRVVAAHYFAVSCSVASIALAGLVAKPLLANPAMPSIIVSLDILILPLRAYRLFGSGSTY